MAMGRTVEELLLTMSAKELTEWMAFSTLEPFGDERADLRTASIVLAVSSPHLKKGKTLTLKDCMLKFEPKKKQSPEDIMQLLKGFSIAKGGVINDGNG